MSRWMHKKDELSDMGQQKVALWARCTEAKDPGRRGVGGGGLRTEDARMERLAAGHRPSWFLTEEAQTEAQVLLPAAVCCYHRSQHCCLASPEAAALQHAETHTNCNILTHTSLLSCSGRHGRRRVQMRAQPLSQSHETSWPATDIHTLSHTLCGKGTKRERENQMNGKEERKVDVHTRCAKYV